MARTPEFDRDQALEQAVALFWRQGYFASSVKQLGDALDMRPGSLYGAFGSKEGLFLAALERYSDNMGRVLSDVMALSPSVIEGLSRYLEILAEACCDARSEPARACMLIKTLLEVNAQAPRLQNRVNRILDAIEQNLREQLEQARARGELRPDTDCPRLARLLQAQIMALRTFAQRDTDPRHVQQLAEDMAAILDSYRVVH
ncbi:MAG: TetR/AcrR family transcriptional regulator [Oleiphilaceae bacterium]|nr:TetR/AcrR family transcriptional regulator [Oleiphilaceae bacterium]